MCQKGLLLHELFEVTVALEVVVDLTPVAVHVERGWYMGRSVSRSIDKAKMNTKPRLFARVFARVVRIKPYLQVPARPAGKGLRLFALDESSVFLLVKRQVGRDRAVEIFI